MLLPIPPFNLLSKDIFPLRKAFPDHSAETAPSYCFPLSKLFEFTFLKSTYHHLSFYIFVCLLSLYFIIICVPHKKLMRNLAFFDYY